VVRHEPDAIAFKWAPPDDSLARQLSAMLQNLHPRAHH
jgi:hypothetical protein